MTYYVANLKLFDVSVLVEINKIDVCAVWSASKDTSVSISNCCGSIWVDGVFKQSGTRDPEGCQTSFI